MFDARPRTRESHGQGLDHGLRYPRVRGRPQVLLGALVGLVLLALPLAAQETAAAEPGAGVKARGQAVWEVRITEDSAGQDALLAPKVRRQRRLTPAMRAQGPLQGPGGAGEP
jgi:hypothetical protein